MTACGEQYDTKPTLSTSSGKTTDPIVSSSPTAPITSVNPTEPTASTTPTQPTEPAAPEEVLIAPALDPEEVEPTYDLESMDSVYVPELGAATGFRFYTDFIPSNGFPHYSMVKDMTISDAMALLDEYFDLLASLPYFEVLEEPRLVLSDTVYTGVLIYTGTGRVLQEEDSYYNGKTFAFDFYFDLDDRELMTQYAQGLKIVDTGHRLTGTDYPSQQVYGPHICADFYECGGTYYSSDLALVAQSGECAILLNGEPYTGSTAESNIARYYVEGFHRSDWIEIFLRENYPMDEDIYGRSDLLQYKINSITTTTKDDFVVLSVSDNNGADWNQPRPRRNDDFEGSSIRVIQWESEGVVVLYFYADLYLDNEPYEIEGLLVTNPKENEARKDAEENKNSGSSGGDTEQTCSACTGSGRCGSCGGSGYRTQWIVQKQERMPCASCATSGRCPYCGGDGKR